MRMGVEHRALDSNGLPEMSSNRPPTTILDAIREQPTRTRRLFRDKGDSGNAISIMGSLKGFLPSISGLPKWKKAMSSASAMHMKPTPPAPKGGENATLRRANSDPRKQRLLPGLASDALQPVEEQIRTPRQERSTSLPEAFQPKPIVPNPELAALIPGKLYFALHANEAQTRELIEQRPDLYVFSSFVHEAEHCRSVFGTVDLGSVYNFWKHLRSKANHPKLNGRKLVYYSDFSKENKANAAFLLGSYLMLEHGMSAAEASSRLEEFGPYTLSLCTASKCRPASMSLREYLGGLEKAVGAGWFDPEKFIVSEYEWLRVAGDMSALCGKFVAFRGPTDGEYSAPFYAAKFRGLGVQTVVRLNEANTYYAEHFQSKGIQHHHLFFPDGSNPSPDIVEEFLDMSDAAEGLVGVHCMAGLGRTGTLICLWMMRRGGLSAREAVAWTRLVRPGSVIGGQLRFLERCEATQWEGNRPLLAAPDSPATVLQLGRASAPPQPRPRRFPMPPSASSGLEGAYDGRDPAAARGPRPRLLRSW